MSKYDCSKTMDYVHEAQRMCETVKRCGDCPTKLMQKSCTFIDGTTQERIDIVQKWSDEHPEKTRKEAFFELFPKCVHSTTTICFYMLIGENKCCGKKLTSCGECWNEPYEGEFEKAREEDENNIES